MAVEIKIGTRGSKLALAQTRWVADHLKRFAPDANFTLKVVDSHPRLVSGNPRLGDGIFVKEIQQALLDGEVTIGVHSLKDVPTARIEGLAIGAIPVRSDPRDCLVGSTLANLPPGSTVGTSSPRRAAQIKNLRPDLKTAPLSGNIPTRIDKVAHGECSAAMLAAAGLSRLGIRGEEILPLSSVLPAPGQGALAVEVRSGEPEIARIVTSLHHEPTATAVRAERAVLRTLGGGCLLPVSAFGSVAGDRLHLQARVISEDGSRSITCEAWGEAVDPEEVARRVAEDLISQGAREMLNTRP